jgi:hypothetical protein
MDSGGTIGSMASVKNIEYLVLQFFILLAPAALGPSEPGVVAATANVHQSAHAAYFECAFVLRNKPELHF